ncbi:MAG: Ig-like domain-containing protein [Gemmatimonadetes bacterium]|nr:Ig-like domain-containing protein [Gemmatimonadota bacterium]
MPRLVRSSAILSIAAFAGLGACDSGSTATQPDPVATVVIAADTSFVLINTTAQLQASARGASGKVLTGVTIAWSSADTSIATVSSDGTVTARSYGKTTVTATADGVSDVAVVWVTGTPGLTVLSGEGVEDTISAPLPAPLVVELRDERGRPAAGDTVYFEGISPLGSLEPGMELHRGDPLGYGPAARVTTNAEGIATVGARMGLFAGARAILARSERLGYADTARYTVRVGAPARLEVTPADSALFPGRTLALRTVFTDRGRNPLTGTVSFSVLEGPVSVNAAGVVSTTGYGTARVEGRIGIAGDTVRVVVVPEGALVAISRFQGLVLMNFDGTGRRVLGGNGRGPAWSPSGDRLVYQSHAFEGTLVTRTLTGEPARLIAQATSGWHQWPQYSRDGEWIYYFSSAPSEPQTIWRVRPNGTGLQKVSTGANYLEGHPSPSPDGTRIAYFVGGGPETYIHVRTVASAAESGALARGHAPTWSPVADLIAFNELGLSGGHFPSGLAGVKPDGTGLRRVSTEGNVYDFSPRWSPDGRWIIASAYGEVHLIEVETGLTIELPFLESILSVDWKPGGLLP